ncbi:hypothetical protein [Actinomadura sp. WMMA1423]|uniref:hypothetical protein n=1 Tax=Actinomadura sp. WMMA1423 TaxID=2591108 RepID=UPI001146AA59|nr:hypothetical protein [Actinomadura sp. WMMA1423]
MQENLPADVGPYETDQQAADTVSHVYAHARTAPGTMGRLSLDQLTAACEAAGVELGAYDLRILRWLAGWEPETCAVIAGIILRAGKVSR